MSASDDETSRPAGYGPDNRLKKGRSGNPKGRPKSRSKLTSSAYDVILHRTLTITENEKQREATVEEALQFMTLQQALVGNRMSQCEVFKMIARREAALAKKQSSKPISSSITYEFEPTNALEALQLLEIASPDHSWGDHAVAKDKHPRLLLEPWAVQTAISRSRSLRPDEKDRAEVALHQRAFFAEVAEEIYLMSDEADAEADEVGDSRPPQSSRFAKDQSGNPRGQPKGMVSGIPNDAVLGQLVTIKDDGIERQVTADEAFLLYMAKQGLAGRESAARSTLATIKSAKLQRN